VPADQARDWAMAAGDDYELLLAVPPQHGGRLATLARQLDLNFTLIGELRPGNGVRWTQGDQLLAAPAHGYDHFR